MAMPPPCLVIQVGFMPFYAVTRNERNLHTPNTLQIVMWIIRPLKWLSLNMNERRGRILYSYGPLLHVTFQFFQSMYRFKKGTDSNCKVSKGRNCSMQDKCTSTLRWWKIQWFRIDDVFYAIKFITIAHFYWLTLLRANCWNNYIRRKKKNQKCLLRLCSYEMGAKSS